MNSLIVILIDNWKGFLCLFVAILFVVCAVAYTKNKGKIGFLLAVESVWDVIYVMGALIFLVLALGMAIILAVMRWILTRWLQWVQYRFYRFFAVLRYFFNIKR